MCNPVEQFHLIMPRVLIFLQEEPPKCVLQMSNNHTSNILSMADFQTKMFLHEINK